MCFLQIQGSARVASEDGHHAHQLRRAQWHPYTPVGRILIERNEVPREEMSMDHIRQWMAQNPEGANELRRQNKSYIFFREVELSERTRRSGRRACR